MFAKFVTGAVSLAVGLSIALPSQAEAHRHWLLPSATVLAGESGIVSVDAAASNALFVFEHRPMGLDDLIVTGPDGQTVQPVIIGSGAYRSVFRCRLGQAGNLSNCCCKRRPDGIL